MSAHISTFTSEGIIFKNNKNKCYDEDAVEFLIPTLIITGNPVSENHSESRFKLKFKYKTIIVMVVALISLALSTTIYIYVYANSLSTSEHSRKGLVLEEKYSSCLENSCSSLVPVDTIFIKRVPTSRYDCFDSANCSSPLERIEREHNGLNYNFVFNVDLGLYIGLGFKCRVNCTENSLYIKILHDQDNAMDSSYGEEARIKEIVEQGLLCGKIAENYKIFCSLNSEYYRCLPEPIDLVLPAIQKRRHAHYNPSLEMRLFVDKDHKWLACGKAAEKIKAEVVKIESIPKDTCPPYERVDHISVDIVETDPIYCVGNWTCGNMAHVIEHTHDGFKYNFVIGTVSDLYVGLGFQCLPVHKLPVNTLKVKLLRETNTSSYFINWEWGKFSEIVEQGIACGKISPNYTVSVKCLNVSDLQGCNQYLEMFEQYKNYITLFANEDHIRGTHLMNVTSDNGKVIRAHLKMICPKSQHINESIQALNNSIQENSTLHPQETKSSTFYENSSDYETTTNIEISSNTTDQTTSSTKATSRTTRLYFHFPDHSIHRIESDYPYDEDSNDYVFNYGIATGRRFYDDYEETDESMKIVSY